jgi:hypothetical protein
MFSGKLEDALLNVNLTERIPGWNSMQLLVQNLMGIPAVEYRVMKGKVALEGFDRFRGTFV